MPSNLHKKYLEKVIQDRRVEKKEKAADLLSKFQNAGALPEERYQAIKESLDAAFNSYQKNLIGLAIADLDQSDNEYKDKLKSYEYFSNNPGLLTHSLIEQSRKDGKRSNFDCLLLHHVCLLNKFKATLDSTQESLFSQDALVNYLELFNEIDSFSQYALEVGREDPKSFRRYYLNAHTAYSGFTAELFERLIVSQKIDKTAESLAIALTNALRPDDNGKTHPLQLTYDSFDEVKNDLFKNTHSWLLKHTNQVEGLSSNIALKILPSFLGIHNDSANENKYKITLLELIQDKPEIDYHTHIAIYLNSTHSYANKDISEDEFKEYKSRYAEQVKSLESLTNEYKSLKDKLGQSIKENPNFSDKSLDKKLAKLDGDISQLKDEMRVTEQTLSYRESKQRLYKFAKDAITTAKNLQSGTKTPTVDFVALVQQRQQILSLIEQTQELLENELYSNQFLSSEQQALLVKLLSDATPNIKQRITDFVSGLSGVDEKVKNGITDFLKTLKVDTTSAVLLKAAFESLATNKNPKVEYYQKVLTSMQKKLVEKDATNAAIAKGPDAKIVEYIDNANLLALRYLATSTDPTSILKEGDHFSVFGGLFNPTEFGITDRMSFYAADRFKKILELEQVCIYLCQQYATRDVVITDSETNNELYNKPVIESYNRLNESIKKLEKLKTDLERENILLTLDQLLACAEEQIEQLDETNREEEAKAANILRIFYRDKLTATEREQRNEQYKKDLGNLKIKVNAIKKLIAESVDKAVIANNLEELSRLVGALSKKGYNFYYLVDEINYLARYENFDAKLVSPNPERKVESIAYKDKVSIITKRIRQALTVFNIAKGIGKAFVFIFKAIYNLVTYIPGNIIKLVTRQTRNNRNFIKDVNQMNAELENYLGTPEVKLLFEEYRRLENLKQQLKYNGRKFGLEQREELENLESKFQDPKVNTLLDKALKIKKVHDDLSMMRNNIGRVRLGIRISIFGHKFIRIYNSFSYKNLRFGQYAELKDKYFNLIDPLFYQHKFKPDRLEYNSFEKITKEQELYNEILEQQRVVQLLAEIEKEYIYSEESKVRSTIENDFARVKSSSPVAISSDEESPLSTISMLSDANDLVDDLLKSQGLDKTHVQHRLEDSCYKRFANKLLCNDVPKQKNSILNLIPTPSLKYNKVRVDVITEFEKISSRLEKIAESKSLIKKEDVDFLNQVHAKCSDIRRSVEEQFYRPAAATVLKTTVKQQLDVTLRKALSHEVVNKAFDHAVSELAKSEVSGRALDVIAKQLFKDFVTSVVAQQGGKYETLTSGILAVEGTASEIGGVAFRAYYPELCKYIKKNIESQSAAFIEKLVNSQEFINLEQDVRDKLVNQYTEQCNLCLSKLNALEGIKDPNYNNTIELLRVFETYNNLEKDFKSKAKSKLEQVKDVAVSIACGMALGTLGAVLGAAVGTGMYPKLSTLIGNTVLKKSILAAANTAYDTALRQGKSLCEAKSAAIYAVKETVKQLALQKLNENKTLITGVSKALEVGYDLLATSGVSTLQDVTAYLSKPDIQQKIGDGFKSAVIKVEDAAHALAVIGTQGLALQATGGLIEKKPIEFKLLSSPVAVAESVSSSSSLPSLEDASSQSSVSSHTISPVLFVSRPASVVSRSSTSSSQTLESDVSDMDSEKGGWGETILNWLAPGWQTQRKKI